VGKPVVGSLAGTWKRVAVLETCIHRCMIAVAALVVVVVGIALVGVGSER
jgi:hypothetical protein